MIRTHPNLKHVEIPGTKANEDQLSFLKQSLDTFKHNLILILLALMWKNGMSKGNHH
jgi:hypothetical protein